MDIRELKRGERALLRGCFLFHGAPEELADRAIGDDRCVVIEAPAGAVLAEVYNYRCCLGLILAGSVRVEKLADRRYPMTNLRKGGMFGAASLFDEPGETVLVTELTARTDVRIAFFPGEVLRELMQEDFSVTENYIRFLTGRIKFLNGKIQSLIYTSADTALAHYLTEHAGEDHTTVCPNLTALAEELNIARASLYRSFSALEEAGCIKKTGRRITVLDPERLAGMGKER